jgi:hypothetical protein
MSTSETTDDRKRRESNDDAAIPTTTMTITTTEKTLTSFQAQRVLLISKLRELVINGHSPLAIQAELGITQRQYYRLYQKAFEHDCQLIEQWDSDTFRENLAIYKARLQKILAFLMNKMGDPNAHDIIRLKAAQLAVQVSEAIYRTGHESAFKLKVQDMEYADIFDARSSLESYLTLKKLGYEYLARHGMSLGQPPKEEKNNNKNKKS